MKHVVLASAAGLVAMSTLGVFLSLKTVPKVAIDPSKIIETSVGILPGTLIVMAFTAFVATRVRRRSQAATCAIVFLIASWFIDVLGRTATTSFANTLRVISFYAYYDSAGVMQHGLSAVNLAVPLSATAILMVGALASFQKRNIGV